MRRGDLVTVALQASYGKSRLALIIQSDLFDEHPTMTVLPVTNELRETPLFRIRVEPSADNGLHQPSQVMVDKAQTIFCRKIGPVVGRLGDEDLVAVNRALAVFLGFA